LELTLTIDGPSDHRLALFGPADKNLRVVRDALGVKVYARDSTLKLVGDTEAVGKAAILIERLQERTKRGKHLSEADVADALSELAGESAEESRSTIQTYRKSAAVRPKTPGQEAYIHAVADNDLVFCLGPAGTGKTYVAVAIALGLLRQGRIKRIVLARPAVEAGEKLGFLPGDLQAKVNPYLRPLFDAMHDMMEYDQIRRFMDSDVIEVVPLAFMRGRTLNHSAIILDEAQNATVPQMLMFLTRLGHHSKMIVTGDDSQSDLEKNVRSGLADAVHRLHRVPGVAVVELGHADIVRHRLVTEIVHAYGKHGGKSE